MPAQLLGRCTCHSIRENSQGVSYSDYMLGVNCGYCEAMMAEAQDREIAELNAAHPHGAGLAADDYRLNDLYDYSYPCKYAWREAVREAEQRALWADSPWGDSPPF